MNMQGLLNQIRSMNNINKALLIAAMTALIAGIAHQYNDQGQTEDNLATEATSLHTDDEWDDLIGNSDEVSEVSCESQALPSFINVSLGWQQNSYTDALASLSPPSVIVTSAGNNHPEPIPQSKVNASENFDAIIVGNLNVNGTRMPSSNEDEKVHIMAPASYYVATKDGEGSNRFVGGTSGATALVTGSLGAFEWLSGYHPTAEESKILLEKTAVLTQYSHDNPQRNGVGMVNAYMLGMVGKKLKDLCGTDISCFQEKIHEDSIYVFPEDEGLSSSVAEAFPECGRSVCSGESSSCVNKEALFKRLRKAAFLNPSDKQLWRNVACVYNTGGFKENVKGILSIYKSLFGPSVNDREVYTMCEVNSDCTLVPACTSSEELAPFSAVTNYVADIYNIEQCEETTLCNGKCSCEAQENTSTNNGIVQYSSACVNSQCIVNTGAQSQARVPSQVDPVTGDSLNIDDESAPSGEGVY